MKKRAKERQSKKAIAEKLLQDGREPQFKMINGSLAIKQGLDSVILTKEEVEKLYKILSKGVDANGKDEKN